MNEIITTKGDVVFVSLDHMKIGPAATDFNEFIKTRAVGQERIFQWCANVVEAVQQGFWRKNKPVASVILVGPSGVGKTTAAKIIAEYLFGDENAFIRIDCADYSVEHAVARLLGAPPGYVGYGDEPFLTQRKLDKPAHDQIFRIALGNLSEETRREYFYMRDVKETILQKIASLGSSTASNAKREAYKEKLKEVELHIEKLGLPQYNRNKYNYVSVLLVDEIERSHRSLHNLLMKVLDEAQLQLTSLPEDGSSDKLDFSKTIIIATSNLGSTALREMFQTMNGRNTGFKFVNDNFTPIELDMSVYRMCSKAVNEFFSTEFVARFDDVIAARPHSRQNVADILEIEFLKFQKRLFDSRDLNFPIVLRIHNDVKMYLVDEVIDTPEKGVRNLQQKMQKYILNAILRLKARNQIVAGDIIHVSHDPSVKDKLRFEKEIRPSTSTDVVIVED